MQPPRYDIDIDFDTSSAAWLSNKNVHPCGFYSYVTEYDNNSGRRVGGSKVRNREFILPVKRARKASTNETLVVPIGKSAYMSELDSDDSDFIDDDDSDKDYTDRKSSRSSKSKELKFLHCATQEAGLMT